VNFGFNHKRNVIFLLLILAASAIFAHTKLESDYLNSDYSQRFTETTPPTQPVRPIAEFEPASAVMIRYPLGIPVSLVVHLANTAQVVCLVSSNSVQNQATTAFNNAGVNMAKVTFMVAPTDSYWTRDFGPWFIFDGNGIYSVVDFQYNRPRPNDNMIPQLFAQQNSINYYGMNLQQTGGNYMTDGINTAAQTQIAYTENSSLGQTGVNLKMQNYLGITNYYVIQDPNNTYIDHIDCWGKFLAVDKVLIRSVPTSHAQYDEIEAVATFFANQNCAWGYPYKVYRVNTPGNQPYTNSLILNKKVFVPIMGGSYDAAALQVYRNALPGYEVIGITGQSSTPWESTDALHCRTHEIPDAQMLYINHNPLFGMQDDSLFDINAEIRPFSGSPVIGDSVYVSYRVNQGPWQTSTLINLTGYHFTTSLTGFAPGDTIRYYIHAVDQAGKRNDHPLTAAYDPHLFVMAYDTAAPEIVHYPLETISNQTEPVMITALVDDNTGVSQVFFRYRVDGGAISEFPMENVAGNSWVFPYVPEFDAGSQVFEYQIKALDNSNPANLAWYPAEQVWQDVPIETVSNQDQHIEAPRLLGIYPNPLRASATGLSIDVLGKKSAPVEIKIFNLRGQLIRSISSNLGNEGLNRFSWDGKDQRGILSTHGLYLLKVSIDNVLCSRKIVVGL
jgi:agmatine/peptidylarginine deiminase